MTAWLVLLSWAMLVAGLSRIRIGSSIAHGADRPEKRYVFVTMSHSELRARVVVGVLATFAVAPLVFLFAVRQNVGVDYPNYVKMFEEFRTGEALPRTEPLYALLNRIMASLGSSGVVAVFAVSSALAALPLFYRVFRSSPISWLGILILFGLGFPFFMTNVVRAAIAVGIMMLVLPAIWRRQMIVWTLGVLLAAGFHFTVLLVWPLYWLLHRAWPRALVLIGLVAAVVLSTSRELAVIVLQWIPWILPSRYDIYSTHILEKLGNYQFGFGYLIYFGLVCFILVAWDRTRNEGREVLVFRNASILGLVMAIGLYQFWGVNRLALYFLPAVAVFLPWVVMRCVARQEKLFWAAGLAALFGMMFARGLLVGAHDAAPYHWIF